MGKKKVTQEGNQGNSKAVGGVQKKQEELLKTLGDFTSKENWDQFFSIRGGDDSFEWYADWPQLRSLLTSQLISGLPGEVSVLVPGCGNSTLSQHLYDSGLKNITNIDFSKVVISDMLRRNVRQRPEMKWRVMDMTHMLFANDSFDAIVDKGGLDALMEPELGSSLGDKYLSEVKRVLKVGGRFICLTLAEAHVLDLLFPKFRFGWKIHLYAISRGSSSGSLNLHTFMFVAVRNASAVVSDIAVHFDNVSFKPSSDQVKQLYNALEREEKVRSEHSSGASDISYSLEELNLGVKGNLADMEPGRRLMLLLGGHGASHFSYKGVLLDAPNDLGPFSYKFAAFIVPKMRAHEWLFSSAEGQWVIVESSKAARLVVILLDSSNSVASMEDIQKDLSPLVMQLAPRDCDDSIRIPFLAASDGVKRRNVVHQITSSLTGPIVVDDVVYESVDDNLSGHFPLVEELTFRRLTFERSQNLIQSEAVLCGGESGGVDHSYLASSYHNGIISGVMLFASALKRSISDWTMMRTVIIGLGAGLLPMFIKNGLPNMDIQVVELDPVVLDVARQYFGFTEDESLTAHVTDGIKFVSNIAAEERDVRKVDVLIVDVDSSDLSHGLTCPAAEFVEEPFLSSARDSLSENGLLIVNLVTRSLAVKNCVRWRLKKVFGKKVFHLQVEEDVNEVVFAVKKEDSSACSFDEDWLREGRSKLLAQGGGKQRRWFQRIIEASQSITPYD